MRWQHVAKLFILSVVAKRFQANIKILDYHCTRNTFVHINKEIRHVCDNFENKATGSFETLKGVIGGFDKLTFPLLTVRMF